MTEIFVLLNKLFKQKVIVLLLFICSIVIVIPFFLLPIKEAALVSCIGFIAYVILLEGLFRLIYKFNFKKSYKFIPKIPFKKMIFEPHPYLPYVHKKNFCLFYKEKAVEYPLNKEKMFMFGRLKSNNLGFFNGPGGDRDIVIPKPENMIRINCLGASTTGNYIFYKNKPYSYPLELEKVLNSLHLKLNIEVNNCGVGGYTSADILVRFLLDIIDTKPDIVVIYHGYNDLQPSLTDGFQSDYSHSRRNLGEVYYLYDLASKIPNLPLAFWNFVFNYYVLFTQDIGFTVLRAVTKKNADIKNDFQGLGVYRRNIEHIINVCRANNIQVVLATYCHYLYPEIREDQTHLKYRAGVKMENQVIRELALKYNLPLVETDLLIPQEEEYFVDSVHFTPEGMTLLAENISQPIVEYLQNKI